MKSRLVALALAAVASTTLTAPAAAQTAGEEERWRRAERRYDQEREIYERARARYEAAVERDRRGRRYGRYDRYDRYGRYDGRDDPVRYYRDDPRYRERQLGPDDEIYRGSDGRYYCRRSDGTVGLVIGAGVGALLGRAIDTRGERATGTIIGGVLGALIGREVARSSDLRCR